MQLEIKKGGKNKNYRELARNGEEHGKNSRSLMWIYSTEWRRLTGAVSRGDCRRSLWTQQVDAAAGVGEDEKTRGGDGDGARAEKQWREEEDGLLEAHRAGLLIRASS